MKPHELKPVEGSRRSGKRVGRGASSGYGKTSGRGQKGQLARQGGYTRPGFEGGQIPLLRTMPKRGFRNINHEEHVVINLDDLSKFESGGEVATADFKVKGLVKKELSGAKLPANGELKARVTVRVSKASKIAEETANAADGSVGAV